VSTGFKKETCEKLCKTLPRYTRKGHGGNYPYVKGEDVIKALNDAFNHCWSSEKIEVQVIEEQVLMLVSISTYSDGDAVTHQGYGSAPIMRTKTDNKIADIGNTYKSAYTNALKKAAEQFGIGLDSEEESTKPLNEQTSLRPTKAAPRPSPVPQLSQEQQAKIFSNDTPGFVKTDSSDKTLPTVGFKPLVQNGARAVSSAPTVSKQVTTQVGVQPTTTVAVKPKVENDFPTLSPNRVMLSSQQKSALERLSEIRELSEEDAIRGALPAKKIARYDELTQEEATKVITYLSGYQG
jgi:hypothetical protein